MGRGSYLGGCTIVGPGSSWFSNSKGKVKRSSKKKKQQTLPQAKLNYLHLVIDAEIRGDTLPQVPKKSKPMLENSVDRAGGALDWARKQLQYEAIKERKEKNFIKKLGKPNGPADAVTARLSARNIQLAREDIKNRIAEKKEQLEQLRSDIAKDQALLKQLNSAEAD